MAAKTTAMNRIQKRIDKLARKDERINKWRSSVFAIMIVFILFAVFDVQHQMMILATGLAFCVFLFLVRIHRQVKTVLALFESRKRIELRQEGLRNLSWSQIPVSMSPKMDMLHRPDLAYLTDLNIIGDFSLFRLLNQCVSSKGAEALLGLLVTDKLLGYDELTTRQRRVRQMLELRQFRYSFLTRIGLHADKVDTLRVSSIFKEALSDLKSNMQVLWICLLQVAMIALFLYASAAATKPYFLIPAILLLLENSRLRAKVKTRTAYAWSLSADIYLEQFRNAISVLEKYSGTNKPEIAKILKVFNSETSASRRLKQIEQVSGALGVRQNFIVHGLVHLIAPWDILWTLRLDFIRKQIQKDIGAWQTALAEIESVLSLAMFAEANPSYCWPELRTDVDTVLKADDLKHPMLAKKTAIGNPFHLDNGERCVLLTGSNMSGKSTFLRSVGINFILAKAGAPVAAHIFEYKDMILLTSLSGGDSLQEGLSSFYAEVKRLKQILETAKSGVPVLFLIDEIYRGTNNKERLVGSRAYIKDIVATGAKGLVSSHDLELAQLSELGIGIANYHFRESIMNGEMHFTFRKEQGPCPTTNALQVMKLNGLPI